MRRKEDSWRIDIPEPDTVVLTSASGRRRILTAREYRELRRSRIDWVSLAETLILSGIWLMGLVMGFTVFWMTMMDKF